MAVLFPQDENSRNSLGIIASTVRHVRKHSLTEEQYVMLHLLNQMETLNPIPFGQAMHQLRVELGMTQEEFDRHCKFWEDQAVFQEQMLKEGDGDW